LVVFEASGQNEPEAYIQLLEHGHVCPAVQLFLHLGVKLQSDIFTRLFGYANRRCGDVLTMDEPSLAKNDRSDQIASQKKRKKSAGKVFDLELMEQEKMKMIRVLYAKAVKSPLKLQASTSPVQRAAKPDKTAKSREKTIEELEDEFEMRFEKIKSWKAMMLENPDASSAYESMIRRSNIAVCKLGKQLADRLKAEENLEV